MSEISPLVLIPAALLGGVVIVWLLIKLLGRGLFRGETFVEIEGQAKPAAAAQPQATTAATVAATSPASTVTFAPDQLNPASALASNRRPGASLAPFRAMAGAMVKKK